VDKKTNLKIKSREINLRFPIEKVQYFQVIDKEKMCKQPAAQPYQGNYLLSRHLSNL